MLSILHRFFWSSIVSIQFFSVLAAQSGLDRFVISASGDQYVSGNTSLSWTMGEWMADNFSFATVRYTHGFQQNGACRAEGLISLEADVLNCLQTETVIQVNSTFLSPSFLWTFPSGDTTSIKSPVVSGPGIYMLSISDGKGCRRDTIIEVIQDITSPQFSMDISGDTLTCLQNEIGITVVSVLGEDDIIWINEGMHVIAGGPTLTIQDPGTYTVQLTGLNGCSIDSSIVIYSSKEYPVITLLEGDSLDCLVDSIQLMAESATGSSSFQWFDPQNNPLPSGPNPFVFQSGGYRLLVIDMMNGCATDTFYQVVASQDLPDLFVVPPPSLTCSRDTVILQAESGSPGVEAIWYQDGIWLDSSFHYSATTPGLYTVVVYDPITSCDARADVIVLADKENPGLIAFDALIDCMHPEVILEVNSMTTDELHITWISPEGDIQTGSGTVLKVDMPGVWLVVGENLHNGCRDTISVHVDRDVSLPDIVAELLPIECFDKTATLNGGSMTPDVEFVWLDQNGNLIGNIATIVVQQSGTFTLEVIAPDGCRSSQQLEVDLGPTYQLPTIITPNGDGKNDRLILEFCGGHPSEPISLTVFNRWGEEVYHSSHYDHGWEGLLNGLPLPAGQYYYIVEYEGYMIKEMLTILY